MKDERDVSLDRRGFLKSVGGVGAVATAAAVTVVASEPAEAAESDNEKKKARYRETDHVKAFYRTNRY